MSSKHRIATLLASCALFAAPAAFADRGHGNFVFVAHATGAQEVPAADSNARAKAVVVFDRGLTKAHLRVRLRGIETMVLAAHLHCNRAGLNGPPAFGILNPGPLSEIDDRVAITLTNADAVADCTAAIGRPVGNIAGLYDAMRDGLIYLNVHTAGFPPGEVRGQFYAAND